MALEQFLIGVEVPRTSAGKQGPKKSAPSKSAKAAK
jgi:hypothetical protein